MATESAELDVGVNLLWLRPGQVGGTETYARRILRAVASSGRGSPSPPSLNLYASAAAVRAVGLSKDQVTSQIFSDQAVDPVRRIFAERTWLRRQEAQQAHDVFHHLGGTVAFGSKAPAVVTIHDLQPLDHPENFSSTKVRFLRKSIPQAVERAAVVATPSEWVRDQIISRFDLDPERVMVVSAFSEEVDLSTPVEPSPRLERIFSNGPVLLFPAMTLAHKNHRSLFDAFAIASKRESSLQLVCVGTSGRNDQEIRQLAEVVSPQIRMLGRVSRDDLDALYRRSEALVFPSTYEGFGLPIIEAQRHQLPVISANSTALSEVAGDGAILLDPFDIEGWSAAMSERFTSSGRAELVARGEANARRYSIESTRQQQLNAYQRAIA